MTRCPECGGRTDRPGLWDCREPVHPSPTLAQRIVWAIGREVNSRRGIKWSGLDDDLADELRDRLTAIVEAELKSEGESR